ncbi:origin recognition complex subunit 4 C-terminus-domain-containing protein [Morchella snyderi]|nr:origin recognition complex subunit 4 C-terminus-domain-containing protein [Morchella snyderi]
MLIIGARGSGKTTLVESAIADLKLQHPQDFHTVRLTGFHQTDDRLALREILRQLGHEMALPASDTPKTSFADTLTTILAMLSHPDDLDTTTTPLSTPRTTPRTSPAPPKTALSVIFLLDEFDLFTTHPRQTLLYNLFDIAQSRSAPIAVIGTTTHLTITHSLEKRVKSRFSQRTIHLHPPATLAAFWARVRPSLAATATATATAADTALTYNPPAIYKHWNTHLDALHATPAFQSHLRRAFARSASVRAFLNECILPVSALPSAGAFPGAAAFAPTLGEPDNILCVLSGLSDLELSLLIAAARLDIVSDTDTCNFHMAYGEYASLVGGVKVAAAAAGVVAGRVWGREVARGAWERLAEYGLLTAVGKGGAGAEGMWRVEVGLGEIGGVVEKGGAGGGRGGLGKWCREI